MSGNTHVMPGMVETSASALGQTFRLFKSDLSAALKVTKVGQTFRLRSR